jgi:hypothetical protein
MARVKFTTGGEDGLIHFFCPACEEVHQVRLKPHGPWDFNGDVDKPTIRESVLVRSGIYVPEYVATLTPDEIEERRETSVQCHSYVTDGFIKYQPDCIHPGKDFRDQTIELPNKY